MNKNIRFYLVRHGRTSWNEQGLMQGKEGGELTKEGVEGAKLTGNALNSIHFIAAYSSCLPRAINTMQYILTDRHNVPFFQHQGLNEHYFGKWEGVATKDLQESQEFQDLQHNPIRYKALESQGETYEELAIRSMQAIQDIIQIHSNGNILVVSHSHTLRMLLALMDGSTWQDHRKKGLEPSNTSISIVRYIKNEADVQGRFILEKLNDVRHLT